MEENMTLEQANDLLEQAIKQLENKSLPLDESIKIYSRACELIAICVKKLDGYKEEVAKINNRLTRFTTEGKYE